MYCRTEQVFGIVTWSVKAEVDIILPRLRGFLQQNYLNYFSCFAAPTVIYSTGEQLCGKGAGAPGRPEAQ